MKKVLKFVKGKKEERRECGGVSRWESGEVVSPGQTPEEEGILGVENGYGYNVDLSGKDKTVTKLHKAAWQGNLDKLKSALKKVDVDAVDRHGRTALHFAVAQGHPNIVWFLLGNNASTSICDDRGHSSLLKAIECGHRECMTLLLDRGADVNVADYTGNTGLHMAVGRASFDMASSLLKNGADPDVSNNAGDYPLHMATRVESKDLVDLLVGAGAFVDVLDRENRTPLMLAAKTGNRVLAQVFVERGAQLTVVDSNGWTAQDYAMLGGHENVASWLSSRGDEKAHAKSQRADPLSDDGQTDASEQEAVSQKLKRILNKCSAPEVPPAGREKHEDSGESPDAEPIPPYCQPPRSWEMIQAGMIDEKNDGGEPKRRTMTTLGTLHSRRESFAEPPASSPRSTLSLNRRRVHKEHNAFAKNRFSLNEEESLGKRVGKEWEAGAAGGSGRSSSGSDWDRSSVSGENWRESREVRGPGSGGAEEAGEVGGWSGGSGSGTLGRQGTMLGVEEVWVTPEGKEALGSWDSEGGSPRAEKSFPPPPTGLELGVDMARSMRCLKGLSVDQSPARSRERTLWRSACERHSADWVDEREVGQGLRAQSGLESEEALKYQKPAEKLTEVSRRIKEQLECYDQALRELAESSRKMERAGQSYYSLPCKGGIGREEWRRARCRGWSAEEGDGGGSGWVGVVGDGGSDVGSGGESGGEGRGSGGKGREKERKKQMLLAMREAKHPVEEGNGSGTSMEEQVVSPLGKGEVGAGLDWEEKWSPKGVSSGSGGNSPAEENPFFGVGRQETVVERNDDGRESEESGTGEESTLWLQDEPQKKDNSDDEVAEIDADEGPKHERSSSFSPLGVIHREMEEETRGHRRPARRPLAGPRESPPDEPLCGENEDQNEEQSPDVSLSSGPIEPLGAEKDSGSEPETSHNDASPPQNYALRSQHEWLKSHLKAATSEKNKLEELTAQLTEKAERLQYELADAKEAGKSRDEVIQLLQGQLARMEAAYTKSLEESVQSRLQLTCHEQEILHLKELCYRYQEEKEAAGSGVGGEFLEDLELRIKMLEEEKEKMREEISNLEEEKSLLEGQLRQRVERQGEEAEMAEQCQRWKERCKELEEMVKGYASKEVAWESLAKEKEWERQEKVELERKLAEAREENVELRAKVERERRRARGTEKEKEDVVAELRRRNVEIESELRRVEEEMEEQRRRGKKGETEGGREGGAEGGRGGDAAERKERRGRGGVGVCGTGGERVRKGRLWECWGGGDLGEVSASCGGGAGANRAVQDSEYLELKKQILSLESKMRNEKNVRHSLENEMIKMRVSLSEKENLEMEVDSLKRKVGGQWLGKSGMELVEYERNLQAKREKYLSRGDGVVENSNDYKAKCQLLAREREKSKLLNKSFRPTPKTFLTPPSSPSPPSTLHPYTPSPYRLLLHPRLKNDLNYHLDKTIHRYIRGSPSTPSLSSTQM